MTASGHSEETHFGPSRRGQRLLYVAALGAGVVLGLLAMMGFARVAQAGLWNRVAGFVTGRPVRFDVSSPTVVEKIKQLSRLETVEYSLDKIVEGDRQSAYLPDFLAGDKLLLVAHGEVIAGIDWASSRRAMCRSTAIRCMSVCRHRRFSRRGSITAGLACIPGRRAYWFRPIQIWSLRFA